jgi:phage terminase large subunit-like protein
MRNKTKFERANFLLGMSEMLASVSRAPNNKQYSPHDKQVQFHESRRNAKLYIGGNRSGKTVGGVNEGIWRATCTHPYRPDLNAIGPNRGRVVGVDFTNGVEKNLYPLYKQWLYPSALRGGTWETAFDKSSKTLVFSNGSTIEFMSYDQDLDKFSGTSRHWVHFDEEPPKPIWVECMARLIDTEGDYWITMTPVEGMTWIHDDLYEPNVDNKDGTCEIIQVSTFENPYLSETSIKDKWLWIMGLDHGLNNPTAVLWMAVDPNGFCVVFDEHYASEMTIEQHAEAIKRKIRQHNRMPDLLVADPSIKNRNAVAGASIQQEYMKYGFAFTLGNNSVKDGIVRVSRYLKRSRYIGNRPQNVESLFSNGAGANQDEFYRLRITPNCTNLIHELKRYRWKTYANKKLQYENNPYDEPHKKDDHACDALRYMIMTRPDLYGNEDAMDREKLNGIMTQLESRISQAGGTSLTEVADPNGLLEAAMDGSSQWEPDNHMPGPVETGWDYDEHMGGYY